MQNTAARKRKQVPEGYLIVGIDPHKKKHAAVAITQDLTIRDRFKLDNTKEGLEFMVRRVRTEMVKSDCRGVMFAIETGGHYWRNIAYYLDEQGIAFRFINQYTLKRRREGKDLNHKIIVTVRWRHNSCVPASLLRAPSRRVFMPNCEPLTMPIVAWSKRGLE
jgi:Transposase